MLGYIESMICSRMSRGGVYRWGRYPNHVKSLKCLVFKETVESCRWRSETRNLNSGLKQLMKITTASLRGGWVPKTSWNSHYWQPAPRWRLHRWLAKPDKLAMSPDANPADLRAEMARREGLMVPQARALNCPLPAAPNDHRTARDHANSLDHCNVPTATCPYTGKPRVG